VSHFINFENSYAKELNEICEKFKPTGFPRSEILLKNYALAEELGLDRKFIDSKECLNIFSGTSFPKSSNPISQAYSGHQFGHFNPQLGDGRAILLGEIKNMDIQLKGIGQTPFSRRGDGKSALGPVLREYVISEFMHSINIPTTRSLSAIKTNEIVLRETEQPGGILTRVAKSHIRIGTFEYARCKNNEILKSLADYSINRHYPELKNTDNKYLSFFAAVCDKQAYLISKWMSIGFVHGVMNTDNMTISGETIDYGPCAFMDRYNPRTVFSSIDHNGRYSYQNQPAILVWNLSKFAETLIPLIDENREKSVKQLTEVLQLTMPSYQEYFYRDIGKKLGLLNINNRNIELINSYLKILESDSIDFTLSFTDLSKVLIKEKNFDDSVFSGVKNFENWYQNWIREITTKNTEIKKLAKDMNSINPCYIPRNHIIEKALNNANNNDMSEINKLLEIFKNPFEKQDISEDYLTPSNSESPYVTFCGT